MWSNMLERPIWSREASLPLQDLLHHHRPSEVPPDFQRSHDRPSEVPPQTLCGSTTAFIGSTTDPQRFYDRSLKLPPQTYIDSIVSFLQHHSNGLITIATALALAVASVRQSALLFNPRTENSPSFTARAAAVCYLFFYFLFVIFDCLPGCLPSHPSILLLSFCTQSC